MLGDSPRSSDSTRIARHDVATSSCSSELDPGQTELSVFFCQSKWSRLGSCDESTKFRGLRAGRLSKSPAGIDCDSPEVKARSLVEIPPGSDRHVTRISPFPFNVYC